MGFFDFFKKKAKEEVKKPVPGQYTVRQVLDSIEDHKSYYAGGTLCVDKMDESGDVLMLNLSGDYFWASGNGEGQLSRDNRKKLFEIYKKHKGETNYYKEQLKAAGWKD